MAKSLAERLWAKVDKSGGPDVCWIYTGARNWQGYGSIAMDSKGGLNGAHRAAWLVTNGPIPVGLQIDHLCRTTSCVNPSPFGARYPAGESTTGRKLSGSSKEIRGYQMRARLRVVPIELVEANAFVAQHHRHHKPVVGHRFSLGAAVADTIVGVAIVGRPVARMNQDGWTVEVNRVATLGDTNCCSFLYGAARRAAFALDLHADHHLHPSRGRRGISPWRGLQTLRHTGRGKLVEGFKAPRR